MRRLLVAALLLVAATSAFADAADEARAAESAFAKAFADRDAAAFFAFVADDAIFINRGGELRGKAAVTKAWSAYFKGEAPFSWHPERVFANGAGDIALSTGPVVNAKGVHIVDYSSIWQKQKDGTWKIIFDGPGSQVCPPAEKK